MVTALMLVAALTFTPILGAGDPLPDTTLIDQSGRPVALARMLQPALISFIYTRCRDAAMCPLVSAKFARLRTLLAKTPVRLIEITLDPLYDRPAILSRYARAVGADGDRWRLLTGEPQRVIDVADRLGIATERSQPGTLVHTEAVILVDRSGRIVRVIDGNAWTPEQVAAEMFATLTLPASPVQRAALRLFGEIGALCGAATRGGLSIAQIALLFTVVLAVMSTVVVIVVKRSSQV